MSAKVICEQCGHLNNLNQVFCAECGAKLDLSKVQDGEVVTERSGPPLPVRITTTVIRVLLALVLVLFLWPVSPKGQRGGSFHADALKAALVQLRDAENTGAAATVSESDVNGYLMKRLVGSAPSHGALKLREVNVTFTARNVIVLVVAGWGPVPLTYEVQGVPSPADFASFEVQHARFGHFPMVGPARSMVARRVGRVFASLSTEREVLENLSELELEEGKVSVAVTP